MQTAKAIAVGGFIFCGVAGLAYQPTRPVPVIKTKAIEQPREPLLSEIIEEVRSDNNLPPFAIEAVIAHESRFDEFAMNPEKLSRCYRHARTFEQRSACASRGLMQVQFVHHGKGLELKSDLFVVRENVRRGGNWLGTCYHANGGNLWKTFGCYNGDRTGKYASAVIDWQRRFETRARESAKNRS